MDANVNANTAGLPASEFEKIFFEAKVLTDALSNAKSAKSKATKMGNFLALHAGREVAINVKGRAGKAKLCMTQGRAKQKLYHFAVRWDDADAAASLPAAAQQLDDGLDPAAGGDDVTHGNARGDAAVDPLANIGRRDSGGNTEEWQ